MASDLKIDIDNVRLNIRVGVIIRHNDDFIIEISKEGRNSVIPGGRIKINEDSKSAIVRELKEEMNFDVDKSRLKQLNVFENFFVYDKKDTHELFFLYEYILSEEEFANLKVEQNYDSQTTYFTYIPKYDLDKYNLLPIELHEIIRG